jgi:hypothetical protein
MRQSLPPVKGFRRDQERQDAALQELEEGVLRTFSEVGYGGVSQNAVVALPDINAIPQVIPADTESVFSPVHVTQDIANDGIKFERAGVWLFSVTFSLAHDGVNAGRRMLVDTYATEEATVLGQTLISVGRNQEGTNFSTTALVQIPPAAVGEVIVVRLSSPADTFATVTLTDYTFDVVLVDNAIELVPPVTKENAYDDYIRATIQPRLWIQGCLGMVNSGSAGAVTFTEYRAGQDGLLTYDVQIDNGGFTGAGAVIDGSGGVIQDLVPPDLANWIPQGLGVVTLTPGGSGDVGVRIEGYEPNEPPQTSGRAEVANILARPECEYEWTVNLLDAYNDGAQPGDWISGRLDFAGGNVVDTGNVVIIGNLPDNNSGVFPYPAATSGNFKFILALADVYQHDVPEAKFGTYNIDLKGHGGSCWEWPEDTFVGDSDYSFGILNPYAVQRFGLAHISQQHYYTALGGDVIIFAEGGNLKVRHNGAATHDLGAITGIHILVTFNKTTQDLVLYIDGVAVTTIPGVVVPLAVGSGEKIGNGQAFTASMKPICDPWQHLWHVDRVVTPTEALDLFNSVP